jgi:hypothetical protein
MLGRKPVVDAQHPRAGHVGNPPGKIAKQRRKAEQIGAAVQVHNVSVWKRAGRGDPLGFDTAGVNYDQLGSTRRGRHEMREAGHPSTDILDLNIRWKPWPHEPRQAEADKLGAQTHLLKPPERTRSRTSSSAGGRAGGRRMPSVEGNKVTNGDQCAKLALVVDVAPAVAVEGGLLGAHRVRSVVVVQTKRLLRGPLLAPFDSLPRCNIMAAIEATTEPYGLVVPEGEPPGGRLLKQQCRLSPKIVSSRVSAKQDGTRFAALADAPPRFGDTDGKAPSRPKHCEIEDDEGHETGIRSRMAFDQQPDTDGDGLTNQHACEEYKQ